MRSRVRSSARSALCGMLIALVGCNSAEAKHPKRDDNTVRYRLLLRENPVSPQEASHCYAACQPKPTPKEYVDCLAQCPGFEITPGEYCSNTEIPPVAACITARKYPANKELPTGLVVLAIVGSFVLAATAVSMCSVQSSQCGMAIPPQ